MDIETKFPVLVRSVHEYLVWVDAEDSDEAHGQVEYCTHEFIEGEFPVDSWLETGIAAETRDYIRYNYYSVMPVNGPVKPPVK